MHSGSAAFMAILRRWANGCGSEGSLTPSSASCRHHFNFQTVMWICGQPAPRMRPLRRGAMRWFTVIGRMKAGVTLKQATADLATVQSRLGKEFPKPDGELTVETKPLEETIVG